MTAARPPEVGTDPDPVAPIAMMLGDDDANRLHVPRWMFLVLAVVGQAIFTVGIVSSPVLGLGQAVIIVALTAYAALKRNAALALGIIAYLPSAEIVWRQTRAPVPYLLAPYAAIGIAVLLVVTTLTNLTKVGRIAIYYFLVLVPSSVLTISVAGPQARELLAFALSGPLAAATLIVFCSQISIEPWLFRRILWVLLVSGIGPLVAALLSIDQYIVENGSLVFDNESNFITSGGFGPVQVSSLMGLTALVAVLAFLAERTFAPKLLAGAIGLAATVFSFLTFSRGGMTATALALAAFALVQARDKEARRRIFTVVVVVFAIGWFFVVPRINAFTNGAFDERFSDTSSGRTELASNDLEVFRHNFQFGVGPGMTKYNRLTFEICQLRSDQCSQEASSHTEFTRMLGEHGLAGLVAIGFIVALTLHAVTRAGPSRAMTVVFLTWAIAQMFYANFRVLGIAFAFAFAFVRVEEARAPEVGDGEADPDAAASAPFSPPADAGTPPRTFRPAG